MFRFPGYNPYFESFVTDGQIYDQYTIQFDEYSQNDAFFANLKEDERVLLFVPQGSTVAIETILTAYLGAVSDESGAAITTTTSTTSSTSSTSTSTTTNIP